MKEINYESMTIEDIYFLNKTGYMSEILFDADNKKVCIKKEEYLQLTSSINDLADSLINCFKTMINSISEIEKNIFNNLKCVLNRKITKKKFIKLLQSHGIQRNEINRIVHNNVEPYTYMRLYAIIK